MEIQDTKISNTDDVDFLLSNKSADYIIRTLRERSGMNRREFSEHTEIPVRTLEDWESSRRTPPRYVLRLLCYLFKYEELVKHL